MQFLIANTEFQIGVCGLFSRRPVGVVQSQEWGPDTCMYKNAFELIGRAWCLFQMPLGHLIMECSYLGCMIYYTILLKRVHSRGLEKNECTKDETYLTGCAGALHLSTRISIRARLSCQKMRHVAACFGTSSNSRNRMNCNQHASLILRRCGF